MVRTPPVVRAALLVLGVAALAACGAAEPPGPPVASLPAAPADDPVASRPASSPGDPAMSDAAVDDGSTPADSARPQRRLDDSPEREAALWNAYNQCLLDNGAQVNDDRQAAAGAAQDGNVLSVLEPIPAEATQACLHLLPLLPPELDPALNSDYHDDFVAWVTCMQERGMPVRVSQDTGDPTAISWTYDSDHAVVPGDAATIETECQLTAFGGGQ